MLYKGRGYTHFKILEIESGWNMSPGIGSSLLTTPAPQLWSIFCSCLSSSMSHDADLCGMASGLLFPLASSWVWPIVTTCQCVNSGPRVMVVTCP